MMMMRMMMMIIIIINYYYDDNDDDDEMMAIHGNQLIRQFWYGCLFDPNHSVAPHSTACLVV